MSRPKQLESADNFSFRGYVHRLEINWDNVPKKRTYPFSLPAIRSLSSLVLHPQVTFIVGENGTGKSTLIEAIAVAWGFNAEGGSRNFEFATRASHSRLSDHLTLVKGIHRPKDGFFLRAESFFTVASEIERLDKEGSGGIIDAYGGRSLHEQSHGESFMALLMNRFHGNGFYVLDEPEAALSPMHWSALQRTRFIGISDWCRLAIALPKWQETKHNDSLFHPPLSAIPSSTSSYRRSAACLDCALFCSRSPFEAVESKQQTVRWRSSTRRRGGARSARTGSRP